MAGEQLLNMLKSKGGSTTDYSDVVYGKVISEVPLKIQLSNQIILDDNFLVLGKNVTKHTVKMTYKDRSDSGDTTRTENVTIDESLKSGDKVTMIRRDGGQQFYVFERE